MRISGANAFVEDNIYDCHMNVSDTPLRALDYCMHCICIFGAKAFFEEYMHDGDMKRIRLASANPTL